MAEKRKSREYARREFLKKVAGGGALAPALGGLASSGQVEKLQAEKPRRAEAGVGGTTPTRIQFPRIFSGRNLNLIAFPLGGIGTGTISLGGRGQLRDWEIFNRPDKGNTPDYCFPAIWAQVGVRRPVARVLEARIEPPYETTSDGLGSANAPGLPRLASATFTGAYPIARIAFRDETLPVRVSLEAFNPLVPLDIKASGLPVALMRYSIKNPNSIPARVGVAFSLQNSVGKEGKQSDFREEGGLSGLLMTNPFLPASDSLKGSLALSVVGAPAGSVTYLRGWKRTQWWDGALTFWDDFTADGALTPDAPALMPVGSIAVTQSVPARSETSVTFLIAWHFPNRTPHRCGWSAAEGQEETVVGNYYTKRFRDAWEVSRYVSKELSSLEGRTRAFVKALETSTLPPSILDAATSTLSTLRTNTCFQTPDGEFHGFEGCNDHSGCCHGSCTHVWNYEQATAFVFGSLARSLRESEFLRNTTMNGQMGFRSYLPDGLKIWDKSAADGQMGCLMKLYRDWRLSGDTNWLRRLWPQAKRALEFAWIENGWDGDRDGVAEGAQHNTYDVEFYGPNPLCGVWYLGGLRAGEEMARALGEEDSAREYRRLFEKGSRWLDANLFHGEFYIQKVMGRAAEQIPAPLRVGMGAGDSTSPDYQMGEACLVDQLVGQYMAHVAGLGYLLDKEHVQKTLQSIFRYNYRSKLSEHECVQRTYALNDEGGVLVATYPKGKRPEIPFPYFGEIWTGLEYQFAAHLIFEGMVAEALAVVETARRRFDGERRNPWNELECGHHYARPMAAWALLVALSGFQYNAVGRELTLAPPNGGQSFGWFWSIPCGWGNFSLTSNTRNQRARIEVVEGSMPVARVALGGTAKAALRKASARLGDKTLQAQLREEPPARIVTFEREVTITPGRPLSVSLGV